MGNSPEVLQELVKLLEIELGVSNGRLEEIVYGMIREVDTSGENTLLSQKYPNTRYSKV